jgi:hypothetical protein
VHKILLPLPVEGWEWAGVSTSGAEDVFKSVIREMRRMIDSSQ